jgi:large repetitive protein
MGSVLYAPSAEVDLSGTADLSLGGLIAKTILIAGKHTVSVGVPPATLPAITSPPALSPLPTGLVGKFYSVQYTATGGSGVNTWSAVAGTLPPGLSIDAVTGLLSGTPTTAGNDNPTITVTDNLGDVAQQSNPLTIAPLPTVTSLVPNSRGQGATNQTIAINGTGFVNGATVTFSGSGITVTNTAWLSATKINVTISVVG